MSKDLLVPIFKKGKLSYKMPTLVEIRANTARELEGFSAGIKRFLNPHLYPVGMEKFIYNKKIDLVQKIREKTFKNDENSFDYY